MAGDSLRSWLRLGDRLRSRRLERGVARSGLAEMVGCATSTLYRVESGRQRPSPELLMCLASELELDVAELFVLAEYPMPPLIDLPEFLGTQFGLSATDDVAAVRDLIQRLVASGRDQTA